MKLLKDFRDFAMKGNVIDLAVGVIIGASFGAIVQSLVGDVLMPPIGKLVGNLDFSNLYISLSSAIDERNVALAKSIAATQPAGSEGMLGSAATLLGMSGRLPLEEAKKLGPVIAYGKFLTALINLIIVAFCLFMVVKGMSVAQRRMEREKAAEPPPPPTQDVVLLTEIRDILKEK
ncbi:MAG TPA: large conductance mechanosensitive channel protein MscL [Tepidisphaeraceae bacterium]|nr:large conductance mechanosensitive channel protein MscL [Tepidisphaeraceae bacterium]